MKKKIIKMALILIGLCLLLLILLPPAVVLPSQEGTVTYRYGDVEFQEEMTPEEVRAAAGVLNGKRQHSLRWAMPACGFSQDLSFQIGSVTYYLAQDTCGTVMIGNTHYVHISDEERAILEEIFRVRGGTFQGR